MVGHITQKPLVTDTLSMLLMIHLPFFLVLFLVTDVLVDLPATPCRFVWFKVICINLLDKFLEFGSDSERHLLLLIGEDASEATIMIKH
jgi:hypothetical protein